jgi:V/A-type H+-transporting ATPase subunit K
MKRKVLVVFSLLLVLGVAVFAQEAAGADAEEAGAAESLGAGLKFIGAGLAVGLSCLAGGIAVGQTGAAAIGAISENAELSGKAMPYVGLAEGICLWGFLVALLILFL